MHAHEARLARLDLLANRISNARMVLAIGGIAGIWWSVQSTLSHAYAWLAPLTLFAVAVVYHSRVRRARALTDRAATHYRVGLARIEDRWSGLGNPGTEFEDAHHVYAADLDLFGQGNLFELLSTARTGMGERTLARWLLSGAPRSLVVQRQQSTRELCDRLTFREDLAVLGETAGAGVRPEELSRWAESDNQLTQGWILPAALLLPALLIAAAILWNVTAIASPLVAILLLELGVLRVLRTRLAEVLGSTEQAFDKLRLLADLTARLEHEPLDAPLSKQLQQKLSSAGVPASRGIARLATTVQFIESRRNPIIAALDSGRHVLCQARMANDAAQARDMLAASQRHPDLVTMLVPSSSGYSIDRAMLSLIGGDLLGEILSVEVQRRERGFADVGGELDWRHDWEFSGYNVLNVGAIYELVMRWLGPGNRVRGLTRVHVPTRRDEQGNERAARIPDHVEVLYELANGAPVHMTFSETSGLSRGNDTWIFGSEGTIHVDNTQKIFIGRRGDRELVEYPNPPEGQYRHRVEEEFINAIRGLEPVAMNTFDIGVRYMEWTEAIYRSTESDTVVSLPLAG